MIKIGIMLIAMMVVTGCDNFETKQGEPDYIEKCFKIESHKSYTYICMKSFLVDTNQPNGELESIHICSIGRGNIESNMNCKDFLKIALKRVKL